MTGYDLGFSDPLCCRAVRIRNFTDERICDIVGKNKETISGLRCDAFTGRKNPGKVIKSILMQALTDTCSATRRRERNTTGSYIRRSILQEKRMQCLRDLKEIGYQVGSGFMVGSPYQKTEDLISDLRFLQELQPDMIGIGPFITHQDTPFREFPSGELTLCLRMVAILRHLFPEVLLPATTALGTIHPSGRELGLLAGANVVMPNLSPVGVREKYSLYDNKICTGEEAAECRGCLEKPCGIGRLSDRSGSGRPEEFLNRGEGSRDIRGTALAGSGP